MKVVIVGSGNVATVLGKKISLTTHEVIQIAGRNEENVKALASDLNAGYTTNLLEVSPSADLYIISVSDSSIISVARQLKLDNRTVVHTAAAVSREVLAASSNSYGVLYPLQTLRKEIALLPAIPILVDGNNNQTRKTLVDFASGWADNVTEANDEDRLKLHVAAVFVNNFTNHLFAVAEQFCRGNRLDFNLLSPIIKETIARAEQFGASSVQTGPAVRKDFLTIERHEKILKPAPGLLKLYKALTSSIISFYSH
jgi:predicted short-subunit dehydrogenase-like oxidoreductase (DUF2520 family)